MSSPTALPDSPNPANSWWRQHGGKVALVALVAIVAGVAVSCASSVNRGFVLAPAIPGATYVGSDGCEQCHEQVTKHFASATHARLIAKGPNGGIDVGCQECAAKAAIGPCAPQFAACPINTSGG